MKLKHILILQNKIDLVKESQAKEQYEQILAFVQGESLWINTVKKYVYSTFTEIFSPWRSDNINTVALKLVLLKMSALDAPYRATYRAISSVLSCSVDFI